MVIAGTKVIAMRAYGFCAGILFNTECYAFTLDTQCRALYCEHRQPDQQIRSCTLAEVEPCGAASSLP